jgi:hypothetical protein
MDRAIKVIAHRSVRATRVIELHSCEPRRAQVIEQAGPD